MSPRPLKLSDADIITIRERYHDELALSQQELATQYGTTRSTVSRICRHKIRADLGGPVTTGRHNHFAERVPFAGPADICFTVAASAGYLDLAQSSVRDYLMRGRLKEDSPGLISLDSLTHYEQAYKRFVPVRFKPPPPPPPPTCCTRCTILEHGADGLCGLCRAELEGGKFVLYGDANDALPFDNGGWLCYNSE